MPICHSLLEGFCPLTLFILKTIINLQKFSVQSCQHRHKGSYTGELYCLLLQPCREPYLTRSREDIDACGLVVHSGLYIPVSSSIHNSLLDLVIISPVLALTPHTSLDMLLLKCAGTMRLSHGLIEQTFLVNK